MLPVSQPHWVCTTSPLPLPCSRHVCFPCVHCLGSRLLCQELSEAGPGLYVLPRSKLLRFRYSTTAQTRLGLCFVPFPGPSSSGDQVLGNCGCCNLSPHPSLLLSFLGVPLVRLLRCAICLFWVADLWLQPSWWMSTVQNPKKSWLATKSTCSFV